MHIVKGFEVDFIQGDDQMQTNENGYLPNMVRRVLC